MSRTSSSGWTSIVRRGRGSVLGMASQLLNAATNVLTAYVASLLLAPERFGDFVVAFAAVTVVMAAGRGLLGASVMVHLPSKLPSERQALVGSALGFTLWVGLGATFALALAGFLLPVLWVFVPWIALALLQDLGRYVFLAVGSAGRAFILDLTWALAQGAVLGVVLSSGVAVSLELLVTAWGIGAAAGFGTYAVLSGARAAHPRHWFDSTRDVGGWFSAVSMLGQIEAFVVLAIVGMLMGPAEVAGFRTVQLLVYQPALVFLGSVLTVFQPVAVRARDSRNALWRVWKRVSALLSPLILTLVLIVFLRQSLMELLFPLYVPYSGLVVPVAVQSFFLAVSIPPLTILQGLRLGPTVLRLHVIRTALVLICCVTGIVMNGSLGLAWALAVAMALSFVQVTLATRRAILLAAPGVAGRSIAGVSETK